MTKLQGWCWEEVWGKGVTLQRQQEGSYGNGKVRYLFLCGSDYVALDVIKLHKHKHSHTHTQSANKTGKI